MDSFHSAIEFLRLGFLNNIVVLANPLSRRILAVAVYIVVFLLLKKVVKLTVKTIHHFIENRNVNFRVLLLQQVEEIPKFFYIILELYIPLKLLVLPEILDKIINGFFTFVVLVQVIQLLNNILLYSLQGMFSKKGKLEKTTANALKLTIKITLRIIGAILLMSNLGIEVSPLLASLGIWGIAVAFAMQNMLQDIFSSFSIILSRPFKVGDFISLWGDYKGTVIDITMKATRIKTIKGHQIRIPNKELINSKLENFGNMEYRRVRFDVGVTYDTPVKVLKEIPKIIEKIVAKQEIVDFERCKLTELGAYSLNFKVSVLIQDPTYNLYLDLNEELLLGILEQFEKKDIEIAFPTQVIHAWNEFVYPAGHKKAGNKKS